MLNKLALIQGDPVIPDGWACVYGQRLSKADPQILFTRILENDYYYNLREIRARWDRVAGEAPSIEIFRDLGNRAYQQGNLGVSATDLRNVTTPGEGSEIILRPAINLDMWFPPGSLLKIIVTGYLSGGNLDLIAHGRYYLDPEAA